MTSSPDTSPLKRLFQIIKELGGMAVFENEQVETGKVSGGQIKTEKATSKLVKIHGCVHADSKGRMRLPGGGGIFGRIEKRACFESLLCVRV